jgi:hypothetical protein
MSVLGTIAATNMSTRHADAQVDPRITHFKAFLAAFTARHHFVDLVYMFAFLLTQSAAIQQRSLLGLKIRHRILLLLWARAGKFESTRIALIGHGFQKAVKGLSCHLPGHGKLTTRNDVWATSPVSSSCRILLSSARGSRQPLYT